MLSSASASNDEALPEPPPPPTLAEFESFISACMRARSYLQALRARQAAALAHFVPATTWNVWLEDATGCAALAVAGHPDADGCDDENQQTKAAFDACVVASLVTPASISAWGNETGRAAATAAASARETANAPTTPLCLAFCDGSHVAETAALCRIACVTAGGDASVVRRCLVYACRLRRLCDRAARAGLPLPKRMDATALHIAEGGSECPLEILKRSGTAAAAALRPDAASLWRLRLAAEITDEARRGILEEAMKIPLLDSESEAHPLLEACAVLPDAIADAAFKRASQQRGANAIRYVRGVQDAWQAAMSGEQQLAAHVALANAEKGRDRGVVVWEHAVMSSALRASPTAWMKLATAHESSSAEDAATAYERALIANPTDGRLRRRALEWHGIAALCAFHGATNGNSTASMPPEPCVRCIRTLVVRPVGAVVPDLNKAMAANGRLFDALVHSLPYSSGGAADYHDLYRSRSMILFQAVRSANHETIAEAVLALREHNLAWLECWDKTLSKSAVDASEGYVDVVDLWGRQENSLARLIGAGEIAEEGTGTLFEMCLSRKDESFGGMRVSVSGCALSGPPAAYAGLAPLRSLFAPPTDTRHNTGAGPGYPLRGCARTLSSVWRSFFRHEAARSEQPEQSSGVDSSAASPDSHVAPALAVARQRFRSVTAAPWLSSLDGGYAAALPLAREALILEATRATPQAVADARDRLNRVETSWIEQYEVLASAEVGAGAGAGAGAGTELASASGDKRKRAEDRPSREKHTIFVKNLAWSVTEEALKNHIVARCAASGTPLTPEAVVSVMLARDAVTKRSRGIGFVDLWSEEALATAVTAIAGSELNGRAMMAEKAAAMGNRPPRAGGRGDGGGRGRGGGGRGRGDGGGGRAGPGRGTPALTMRPRILNTSPTSPAAMEE